MSLDSLLFFFQLYRNILTMTKVPPCILFHLMHLHLLEDKKTRRLITNGANWCIYIILKMRYNRAKWHEFRFTPQFEIPETRLDPEGGSPSQVAQMNPV